MYCHVDTWIPGGLMLLISTDEMKSFVYVLFFIININTYKNN